MNFDQIVQDYVLNHGKAFDLESYYYGWKQWEVLDHMEKSKTCKKFRIVGKVELIERSIAQFSGTFSGDKEEIGLELRGDIVCKCGKHKVNVIRLTGSFSDILLGILKENNMITDIRTIHKNDEDYHYEENT